MKKHLIFVVLIFVITNVSFAQKALTRFGFRAGPNVTFAKYRFSENDTTYYNQWPIELVLNREIKQGYSFGMGFVVEREVSKIPKNAFFTSGLTFKGAQHSIRTLSLGLSEDVQTDHTQNFHVFALQVPVYFNYRIQKKISVGVGVYGEWMFTGYEKYQTSYTQTFTNKSGKKHLVFGNTEEKKSHFRSFAAGLRGEAGYGNNRWRLTAQIDLGLTNILPSFYGKYMDTQLQQPLSSMQYRTFGLSFIYMHWPH